MSARCEGGDAVRALRCILAEGHDGEHTVNPAEEEDVFWVCDMCGGKENLRGANAAVGPLHVCTGDPEHDPVDHPQHYVSHASGVKCIQITEHMGFCLGNAVKYIWRADLKDDALEDLRKARWYIDREIARREAGA